MTLDICVHGATFTEAYAEAKAWADAEPRYRFVRIDSLTQVGTDRGAATVVLEEIEPEITDADRPTLWGL